MVGIERLDLVHEAAQAVVLVAGGLRRPRPGHPSGELAGRHVSYSPCAGRASASACAAPSASWSAKSLVARMSARESAAGAATWCLLRGLGCLGELPGFATRLAVGCALIDASAVRAERRPDDPRSVQCASNSSTTGAISRYHARPPFYVISSQIMRARRRR